MRRRFLWLILLLFVLIDAVAWTASYRAATAPPPEELARQAAAATPVALSSVAWQGDGLDLRVPLTGDCAACAGPWRYRQTGGEMKTPFDGSQDYFAPDLDVGAWRTMDLPQNWYLAGLNYHGVIWFRQEFTADAAWQGRAVQLRFDGVDYDADIWLNGAQVGRHVGSFQPFGFDVSGLLRYGAKNVLVARVDSPYEEYDTVWPHRKTLIKGILAHHNARPGGAWTFGGQEYNTGGIWGPVWLQVSDALTVDAVQVQATWPATVTVVSAAEPTTASTDANVQVRVSVRNFADEPVQATVRVTLTPRNFEGPELALPEQGVTLRRGETTVDLAGAVARPVLWWPWDRGDPNLYTVRAALVVDGVTVAAREAPFGFRQVMVDANWRWTVNGQRYFPRGTAYISTQWLSQADESWLHRDVQLMHEANLNFIRVQAHVEPPAFYSAADELGMLVGQEFPLQWGYSDAPAFVDDAQRQLGDMIELLFNHPSIVTWTMHNESPWATPALGNRMDEYDRRQNKRLNELLAEKAQALDSTRAVHLSAGDGDAHVYPGWNSGVWTDYADLPGAPFVGEFGAQALPNVEMMVQMFPREALTYRSGETRTRWEFHNFQPHETFDVAKIDPGRSTRQFVANSQAYQANLLQFAVESYRRAKYDPMQGIVQFMFADAWPAISWSVMDYHRRPKAGYYALQTAMQPVLPSIAAPVPSRLDGRRWVYAADVDPAFALWVVNDYQAAFPGARLRWQLVRGERAKSVLEDQEVIDIQPDEARQWALLSRLGLSAGAYRLSVSVEDDAGRLLGHNEFEFAIEAVTSEHL